MIFEGSEDKPKKYIYNVSSSDTACFLKSVTSATVNYPKYPVFFKEQNAGFSKFTLIIFKKGMYVLRDR